MSAQLEILTGAEVNRLATLEGVIQRAHDAYVEFGRALAEIRDRRLYRQTHSTFGDYCRERWGFSRQTGYDLMQTAAVAELVQDLGHSVPTREQARALAPLRNEPEQLDKAARELKNPATDKQLAYLRSLGLEPHGPISKKTASKRIDELKRHRICTCATCGQHWDRETRRAL